MTNKEISEEAEKKGFIYKLSEGIYAFSPKMVRVINDIKTILIDGIAKELNFQEWIFPRIIPEQQLKKTGWLKHHPNQAFVVHTLPNSSLMTDDRYMLDPIQCISLYALLFQKDIKNINGPDLPIKIFETAGGWTFRNETNLNEGLFKSKAFLRVEFVYLASYNETIEIRNSILDKSINLLNRQFGLSLTKAQGDSCFLESPPEINGDKYELIGDAVGPLTPAIDIVFKRSNEYIELASGTIVHDFITKNFGIKSENISNLSSGCFGFGLNRIASVILETKNFNYP